MVFCVPPPGARATWGMEATVSVSTVMLCREPSPALPLLTLGFEELDCRVARLGTLVEGPDRRPVLMLPVSLPLSLVMFPLPTRFLTNELSAASDWEVSDTKLSRSFSSMESSNVRGEPSGLTSWTVSSVFALAPAPRAGVLTPEGRYASSLSVSDCVSG